MIWVGKLFNPRPERTDEAFKASPPSARYQAGLMDLDELGLGCGGKRPRSAWTGRSSGWP